MSSTLHETETTRREMLKKVSVPDYAASFEVACLAITALRKRNAELLAALTQVRDWDDDRQKLGQMAMPLQSRAVIDHAILAAAKGEPS